ncbi:MAG: hypothetical protein ABIW49_10085, partial [Knoellia sp.]
MAQKVRDGVDHGQGPSPTAVFDGLPEEFTRFRERLGDFDKDSHDDIPAEAFEELNEARDDLEQAL